jgi:hypothetical protein
MTRRGLATIGFAVVLLAGGPAIANHDQGHGNSQDHLHRNNPGGGVSATVVAVPGPSSGAMLALGVAAWLVYRRRR